MTSSLGSITGIIYLLLGAILGGFIVRLLWKPRDIGTVTAISQDLERRLNLEVSKYDALALENTTLSRNLAACEARTESERTSFERERKAYTENAEHLEHAFRSIGSDILTKATETLERKSKEASHADERTVRNLVDPIATSLGAMKDHIAKVEIDRRGDYEGLSTKLESLGKIEHTLNNRITDLAGAASGLSQALRNPSVRGNWGEFHLRRAVEIGGMLAHCDFEEQKTLSTDEGGGRPDLVVNLADRQHIFVDAKAPLAAFLDALAATDDRMKADALKRHAQAMRQHIRTLASRNYGKTDVETPNMVVMYVPSEGALHSALAEDPILIELALESNITVTGPIQLITLLRLFATGWRQQEFQKNAYQVVELAVELHERIEKIGEHARGLHRSITNTVTAYNSFAGSMESRILPTVRKLEALGAVRAKSPQEELPQIFEAPRLLTAPELTGAND